MLRVVPASVRFVRALASAIGLVAACARELPSTRPLGTGPLAGAADQQAPSKKTATNTNVDADEMTADAGSSAAVAAADAALADAQSVAAADAGAKGEARPSAQAAVSFAGDFYGKDANVVRLAGIPPSPPAEDPKARITVTEERDKRLAFALYGEGGNIACTLHATTTGNTAQFSPGQECIGGKVARGTARLDGDTLTVELILNMELREGDQAIRGTLEYHFEGRRKK